MLTQLRDSVVTKAVVLLSGGMDSATALAMAIERTGNPFEVLGLSFNYGQRHGHRELNAAYAVVLHYGVQAKLVDLHSLGSQLGGSALTDPNIEVPDGHYEAESMRVTVVPNRNAIMLSIAFGIARAEGATQVWAGMHAGDHFIYPDCRQDFLIAFARAMDYANVDLQLDKRIQLVAPFTSSSKSNIARWGVENKVPYELTYSCYKGGTLHCGTCGTCTERREAFQHAGLSDPTEYAKGVRT